MSICVKIISDPEPRERKVSINCYLKTEIDMENALEQLENIGKRIESQMDIQFKRVLWPIGIGFTLISIMVIIYKFI